MKYEIIGEPMPVVVCDLEANEAMITERGSMVWMSPNMKMETGAGGIGKAFGRMFSGESMFQNTYTAQGGAGMIAFASSFPGSIKAVEIDPALPVVVQKSCFLVSEQGVELSIFFQKKAGAGFFGGEGFIMQKLSGRGTAFLEVDGYAVEYELQAGQSMVVDSGNLAMMDATCTIDIQMVKGVKNVLFDGEDIYDPHVDVTLLRKKAGMVFQQPNPFPMSIYDNIAYGPRIHGIKNKAQLDEIVETSLKNAAIFDEVKDRLKKSALGLSGGQQQRLCIARALAVSPEILLMDEPTSALDPISTMKIEDLMADLREKYTVVIVTHNMQQAARISDDLAFFLVGEMVEFGDTKQIFSHPQDKRTEDYISGRFG